MYIYIKQTFMLFIIIFLIIYLYKIDIYIKQTAS